MQPTSLNAYRREIAPSIGERQQFVLNAIRMHDTMTDKEIKDYLGWEINCVTGRRNELVKLKLIRKAGERICKSTGRRAICWESTPADGQFHLFF